MVRPADSRAERLARLLSGLALGSALLAAGWLLWPRGLADVFFAAWVAVGVALAAVGAAATWTRRRAVVWATAGLLVGLSIVGLWSVGSFIAPAALALLGAAVVLQARGVGGRSPPADPPSAREALGRTVGGAAAIGGGAWLAYEGAIVRELFGGACGAETPACAVAVANPDGIGLTALGVLGIGLGAWSVWQQLAIRLALARNQPG